MSKHTLFLRILLVVSIISVFFIISISSIFSYLYDLNYYDKKYQQYKIYDRFSKETAGNATKNLFGYFQSKNELDMAFFNEQEKSHLNDVKIILQKIQFIYIFSLIIFWTILLLVYLLFKKIFVRFFSQILLLSGIFSVSLILLFALIYLLFGFDFLFLKFHEIFFIGNYAFDPAVSNMKALFPDEFFFDISLAIVLRTLLKAIMLTVVGYFLMKKD